MSKRNKANRRNPNPKALQAVETRDATRITPASVFHRLPGVFSRFNAFESLKSEVFKNEYLREAEDRRLWRPDRNVFRTNEGKFAAYGRRDRQPVPMQTNLQDTLQRWPMRVHFYNPQKTLVCVRREMRRRTLFAMRKIGSGAKGRLARPQWNASSYVVCKKV